MQNKTIKQRGEKNNQKNKYRIKKYISKDSLVNQSKKRYFSNLGLHIEQPPMRTQQKLNRWWLYFKKEKRQIILSFCYLSVYFTWQFWGNWFPDFLKKFQLLKLFVFVLFCLVFHCWHKTPHIKLGCKRTVRFPFTQKIENLQQLQCTEPIITLGTWAVLGFGSESVLELGYSKTASW